MNKKSDGKNNLFDFIDDKTSKIYLSLLVMAIFVISGVFSYKFIDKLIGTKFEGPKNNDKRFEITVTDSIYMNNQESYNNEYYFKDNFLYDSNNKKVNLVSFSKPVYIEGYKIDDQTLKNMNLSMSNIPRLTLDFSTFTDDCVSYLPSGLKVLTLNYCDYLTNLDSLPDLCPELTKLSINGLPSLRSLDFIYKLKNLKQLEVSDSALLTKDLLKYLESNGIETNITKEDVEIAEKINTIFDKIINSDMSEVEKVRAISLYVAKNFDYQIALDFESTYNPLRTMVKKGKGACSGYAYVANVLLNKAGIKSFVVRNENHAWNLIEINDTYYYLDVTNMYGNTFKLLLLNSLDFEKYYMMEPGKDGGRMITSPKDEATLIPASVVRDIDIKNKDVIFSSLKPDEYEDKADMADTIIGILSLVTTPLFGYAAFVNSRETVESLKRKKKRG